MEQLYTVNKILEKTNGDLVITKYDWENTLIAISEDGNICGGVCYTLCKNTIIIDTLTVHPDYRRQGVGTLLIQEIEKRHPNKKELCLIVALYNVNAMLTYDKLGFDIIQQYLSYE
jgi:ribosomal protein S18 acetylase RimI-like enzyme